MREVLDKDNALSADIPGTLKSYAIYEMTLNATKIEGFLFKGVGGRSDMRNISLAAR